jgi:dUTPase
MKIYVKRVDGLTLPFQAVKKDKDGNVVKTNAAAYDVIATSDPKIVGEGSKFEKAWRRIDYIEYETGLYVQPSTQTHHLLIYPRSSNSKYNLLLANGVGLIDNDYRGQICVRFKYSWQPEDLKIPQEVNMSIGQIVGEVNYDKIYKKGDVVCQILCESTTGIEWVFVDELNQTVRGEGGFGSTSPIEITEKTLGYNPNAVPIIDRMKKLPGIVDKYKEAGGIPVKLSYSEEIKKREQES